MQTGHLTEDHLLTSLSGNRLGKELANLTGVEVVDEPPDLLNVSTQTWNWQIFVANTYP